MTPETMASARDELLASVDTIRTQADVIAGACDAQDAEEALDVIQTVIDSLRKRV